MDLNNEPYIGYDKKRPGDCYHLESSMQAEMRYVVIGHSQVRNKWLVKLNGEELDFPVDWISFSGGQASFLLGETIKLIASAEVPLRVIADVWQNSIGKVPVADLIELLKFFEKDLKNYNLKHKVALATCQFAPDLKEHWDDISDLNEAVREYNIRSNIAPLNLHKASMVHTSKKPLKVAQSRYREYNQDKSLGYHLDSVGNVKYVQIIRKHLLKGFNLNKGGNPNGLVNDPTKGHNPSPVNHLIMGEKQKTPIKPMSNQTIQMRKDKKWDARSIIQRKRALSTAKESHKQKAETTTHTEFQVMMDKNGINSQDESNNNKVETLRLDIIEIEKKQKDYKELQKMEKEVENCIHQYKDMKNRFDERQRKIIVNDELLKAKEQDQAYREAELVSSEKKLKQRLEDVTTGVGLTKRIKKCLKRLSKDDEKAGKKKRKEEKGRQDRKKV